MRMDKIRDMRSRSMRMKDMRDGRNPYGSRGGYVTSDRMGGRDYGRMGDYGSNSEYTRQHNNYGDSRHNNSMRMDYGERDFTDGRDYANRDYGNVRRVGNFEYDTYYRDNRDYGSDYGRDYGRDYGMDYASGEYKLSSRELKEWSKDLLNEIRPELRQSFEKENFERKVREMGIETKDYSMDELYLVTLMIETDYERTMNKYGINNIDVAISMARDWLEDDDVDMPYGEKLGAYYFNVVCVE